MIYIIIIISSYKYIYIYILYMHASLHIYIYVLYTYVYEGTLLYEGMFYNIRRYILSSMVRNVRSKGVFLASKYKLHS